MMGWNNSGGFGWAWFPIMAVVMVVCVVMMVRMMQHGASGHTGPADDRDEDAPERILAKRLASGEIDAQEFERLRHVLRRTGNSPAEAADPSRADRQSPPA